MKRISLKVGIWTLRFIAATLALAILFIAATLIRDNNFCLLPHWILLPKVFSF